jgi:hypothetical protein
MTQRWLFGRTRYRRPDTVIRTAEYDVSPIGSDAVARAFIEAHHYAHTYPVARYRFGLYRQARLVGVAVFSHPSNDLTLTSVFGGRATDSTELGRLVLLDEVAANGESWFVARCFAHLRSDGIVGVVSFSDPAERRTASSQLIKPGHIGIVYQALSAVYLGRSRPRKLDLLPDGTIVNSRTLSKALHGEKGRWTAVRQLVAAGAKDPPASDEAIAPWVREWLPRITTPLAHPGNHKYAFPLHRAARRRLPESLAYPKPLTRI